MQDKSVSSRIIWITCLIVNLQINIFAQSKINLQDSPIKPIRNNLRLNFNDNSNPFKLNKFSQYLHSEASAASNTSVDINLFSNLGNNIVNSFKGNNAYLHLAGVASTILIVTTNTDYHVEKFFNEHEEYGNLARPAVWFGTLSPVIVGGSLYAYGKLNHDQQAVGASFAVIQSTLIAVGYNSLLKAITGRPHPDWRHSKDMKSLSKTFRFGFLRGGAFWGWPSGHTSTTMAVISALTNFYPNSTWLKIAGYSIVAYMIYGVSSFHRGGMHWFSDAIAAAFMSYAIGSTVGKFYRSKFNEASNQNGSNNLQKLNPVNLNFSFQF